MHSPGSLLVQGLVGMAGSLPDSACLCSSWAAEGPGSSAGFSCHKRRLRSSHWLRFPANGSCKGRACGQRMEPPGSSITWKLRGHARGSRGAPPPQGKCPLLLSMPAPSPEPPPTHPNCCCWPTSCPAREALEPAPANAEVTEVTESHGIRDHRDRLAALFIIFVHLGTLEFSICPRHWRWQK